MSVSPRKEILQDPGIQGELVAIPACPKCSFTNTGPDELPRRLSFLSLVYAAEYKWERLLESL